MDATSMHIQICIRADVLVMGAGHVRARKFLVAAFQFRKYFNMVWIRKYIKKEGALYLNF